VLEGRQTASRAPGVFHGGLSAAGRDSERGEDQDRCCGLRAAGLLCTAVEGAPRALVARQRNAHSRHARLVGAELLTAYQIRLAGVEK
jgi:hypothetical protein